MPGICLISAAVSTSRLLRRVKMESLKIRIAAHEKDYAAIASERAFVERVWCKAYNAGDSVTKADADQLCRELAVRKADNLDAQEALRTELTKVSRAYAEIEAKPQIDS